MIAVPGQVRQLKQWLSNTFADLVDTFLMYAEKGIDECTDMQLKFQDSRNPSVFVTIPIVGRASLHLTTAKYLLITRMFWVVNMQCQALAQVVRLSQNRVPHTWILNTDSGGSHNHLNDLHHHSALRLMSVIHGLMN